MENEKEALDFSLDDLMKEFENIASVPETVPAEPEPMADMDVLNEDLPDDLSGELGGDTAEIAAVFSNLALDPEGESEPSEVPAEPESTRVFEIIPELEEMTEEPAEPDEAPTLRFEEPAAEPEVPKGPTIRVVTPGEQPAPAPKAVKADKADKAAERNSKLRELKRKIVAGPEKEYYTLNGIGVGKLQIGILLNFGILALCVIAITLFTLGKVPVNRMKLMIFSQVLAMLVSGLLGSSMMMDGFGDLLRLRYSLNSTLVVSFLACCVDAWFCLQEERVPCCGAFVLEMTMATFARYHKRSTEMAQMDTLRKATSLTSLVKEPRYFDNRTGILRGQGDVEDFMDTYARASGPEIVQRVFAFISLIASIGISVLAGLLHGLSMAVQIFACALMVSVPASYFIALTRPTALLEKRLHMVGSVICGWQGVKKLCGKALFPIRDKDLFPKGSTKLNGIKFYSDRTPSEVVSYTASLIFTAGGGLVNLFRNLMTSRNGVEYPVENFRDYGTGGIGGEVNGEPVLLGNLEFLQKMGVEIPKGTMVSQAIYVSIDGQLSAVIAISYSKMRSAAAGLVSLCNCWKLRPLLLAGDFMLTDSFIRSKFSIRTRRMIYPPKEARANLAAQKPDPEADVLALVTRDDLASSVYCVTGSMALRMACRVGTIINIIGGVAGTVIMLALAYLGTTELLTPAHVLLYQLVWLIPGWLATEWTRTV